jgi:hypothetical protein
MVGFGDESPAAMIAMIAIVAIVAMIAGSRDDRG